MALSNKQIILGVTGGIAAYKSADLVRRLREKGALVQVVMTENAKKFITPLTLQALSYYPVRDDLFDEKAEAAMGHIELARWADSILIAPASADFMARLAQGRANDLLTTLCLATSAPIAIAPAMNQQMWKNPFTQQNISKIQSVGIKVWGPAAGSQACGEMGLGRMLEPPDLVEKLVEFFQPQILSGKKVLITAGPTREAIDPVRFISNASSGKMGYALAEVALSAGAEVTLISGPVHLIPPSEAHFYSVKSAEEMYDTVMQCIGDCDILIGAAAVGDYQSQTIAHQKIPKTAETMVLELKRAPDMMAAVSLLEKKPFIVGFAAETHDLIEHAKMKKIRKNMDMIIANQLIEGQGMGSENNAVTVIWGQNEIHEFSLMSKAKLARELIDLIAQVYLKRGMHDAVRCN